MIYDEQNESCIVYQKEWLKDGGIQRLVSFYDKEGMVVITHPVEYESKEGIMRVAEDNE